ncbi:hypothetical protein B0H14DRAFT_3866434, partial [Mycena olivaceomarginata]
QIRLDIPNQQGTGQQAGAKGTECRWVEAGDGRDKRAGRTGPGNSVGGDRCRHRAWRRGQPRAAEWQERGGKQSAEHEARAAGAGVGGGCGCGRSGGGRAGARRWAGVRGEQERCRA